MAGARTPREDKYKARRARYVEAGKVREYNRVAAAGSVGWS